MSRTTIWFLFAALSLFIYTLRANSHWRLSRWLFSSWGPRTDLPNMTREEIFASALKFLLIGLVLLGALPLLGMLTHNFSEIVLLFLSFLLFILMLMSFGGSIYMVIVGLFRSKRHRSSLYRHEIEETVLLRDLQLFSLESELTGEALDRAIKQRYPFDVIQQWEQMVCSLFPLTVEPKYTKEQFQQILSTAGYEPDKIHQMLTIPLPDYKELNLCVNNSYEKLDTSATVCRNILNHIFRTVLYDVSTQPDGVRYCVIVSLKDGESRQRTDFFELLVVCGINSALLFRLLAPCLYRST